MKSKLSEGKGIKKYRFTRNTFIEKYKEQLTIPMIEDLISYKCKNGCINNDRCSDCNKPNIVDNSNWKTYCQNTNNENT